MEHLTVKALDPRLRSAGSLIPMMVLLYGAYYSYYEMTTHALFRLRAISFLTVTMAFR